MTCVYIHYTASIVMAYSFIGSSIYPFNGWVVTCFTVKIIAYGFHTHDTSTLYQTSWTSRKAMVFVMYQLSY